MIIYFRHKSRKSFSLKNDISCFISNKSDSYVAIGCKNGSIVLLTTISNQVKFLIIRFKIAAATNCQYGRRDGHQQIAKKCVFLIALYCFSININGGDQGVLAYRRCGWWFESTRKDVMIWTPPPTWFCNENKHTYRCISSLYMRTRKSKQ